MAKKFSVLREAMSPAQRNASKAKAQKMVRDLILAELRQESGLTQSELAQALNIKQPTLSRLEGQKDMQISTLRRVINGLGGELELIAHLPSGDVRLSQFAEETV